LSWIKAVMEESDLLEPAMFEVLLRRRGRAGAISNPARSPRKPLLTEAILCRPVRGPFATRHLTIEQKRNNVLSMFQSLSQEAAMLRIFVEEAAALTSITLFVGMIAVWAQLLSQF
jgi:hypothetical protein